MDFAHILAGMSPIQGGRTAGDEVVTTEETYQHFRSQTSRKIGMSEENTDQRNDTTLSHV